MGNKAEKLVLILGGARSGKSHMAEEMALAGGGDVVYIATAPVYDEEMAHRVDLHRERRPSHWLTLEETTDLAGALQGVANKTETVLVDCLTLWVTNLLLARFNEKTSVSAYDRIEDEIRIELAKFCKVAQEMPFRTIVVANEVGCGIVPESTLGRLFRDIAGRANQQVAKAADAVILAVAGYPLQVKGGA